MKLHVNMYPRFPRLERQWFGKTFDKRFENMSPLRRIMTDRVDAKDTTNSYTFCFPGGSLLEFLNDS